MTTSETIDALLAKPELTDKLVELRKITADVKKYAQIVHDKYTHREIKALHNTKAYKEYIEAYNEHSKSWDEHSTAIRKQADVFIKTMRDMMAGEE